MSQPETQQMLSRIVTAAVAACVLALMSAQSGHAAGPTAKEAAAEWTEQTQLLEDFAWPCEADPKGEQDRAYRYYGRLAADRGQMGGGEQPHSLAIVDGVLTAKATSGTHGTSWVGMWYSASHTAVEANEVLSFCAPLSPLIEPRWQPRITALYVRVKGAGAVKMELKKDNDHPPLISWRETGDWGPDFQKVCFPIVDPSAYPAVKLINLVVDSPSVLEFDEVGMKVSVPKWLSDDTLLYTLATSYAALLRGYDPASGCTRDHVHWPAGRFDSIPGCGFQALGAAIACDLGLLSPDTARQIASQSVAALTATPKHRGLLPHWMKRGAPEDWSTVDTALALESSLLACTALKLEKEESAVLKLIDAIEWEALINSKGQVSHGYGGDLAVSPGLWTSWDGEGAVVQLLRLIQDPKAPLFTMDASAPIYGGRGFIAEIAALLAPQFGAQDRQDRYGVNWRTRRLDMLAAQKAYYPRNHAGSLAATAGLYGLSAIETIDDRANTTYLTAGLGSPGVPAEDGGGWICPHYAATAAGLDVEGATQFFAQLRGLGVVQPLIGLPEGVKAGKGTPAPERWHSAQITLNGFFNVAGVYHAIRIRDGGSDIVYDAVGSQPRLRAAVNALFR